MKNHLKIKRLPQIADILHLHRKRYASICAATVAIEIEKKSLSGTLAADSRFQTQFIQLSRFACAATGTVGGTMLLGAIAFLEYLFTVDFEVKKLGVFWAIINEPPTTSVKKM